MKNLKCLLIVFVIGLSLMANHAFGQQSLYFPQVVFGAEPDGSMYRSTLLIFNLNNQPVTATLEFFAGDGRGVETTLRDSDGNRLGPSSSFLLPVPPQGVRRFTTDTMANRVTGWARMTSPQELRASFIIQLFDSRNNILTEAGVTPSLALRSFTIYHDSLQPGTFTGLAMVNLSPTETANLTMRMFNINGTDIGPARTISLRPLNHLAAFLTDPGFFPEAAGTEGFLTVSSSTDLAALTLRLDGGQLTTVPVISGGRDIPVIGIITPNQGAIGTTVTIDGQNFSTTPSTNTIRFGNAQAVVAQASPTRLITSVPTSAATGAITVTVGNQVSNSLNFTVTTGTPDPGITSIAPTTIRAGGEEFELIVNGRNFLPESRIRLGSTVITTTVVNTIQLRGRVPREMIATVGSIVVTVATYTTPFGGPPSNALTLTVTPDAPVGNPAIATLDPISGPAGSRVIIQGVNFDPVAGNNLVRFSGVATTVRSVSGTGTQMDVMVPYGVGTGPVTVSARGITSNRLLFKLTTQPELTRIPLRLPEGLTPQSVIYNPVNHTALVTAALGNTVLVIDLAGNAVIATPFSGGDGPTGVAVGSNFTTALAANRSRDPRNERRLGIIDLSTFATTPLTLSRLRNQPFDIAVNPNTDLAVITDRLSSVSLLDLNTNREVGAATIPNANHVAIDPIANRAYITDYVNEKLFVLDLADPLLPRIVTEISVGALPFGVAVNGATNVGVVANSGSNTVSIIDLESGRVRTTIPVGGRPFRVAINPNTNVAVVTNSFDSSVSFLDLNTDRVISTRSTGGIAPQGVAINPINNTAIVTNSDSNDVSIMRLP